jgi:putative addiction module component (TIGR02574 family)
MSTPAAAKVSADAVVLSDEERAAVAEEVPVSLDATEPDSPETAAAFKAELDRRWAAYQAGDEPGIPWPEARARLRARLTRG